MWNGNWEAKKPVWDAISDGTPKMWSLQFLRVFADS